MILREETARLFAAQRGQLDMNQRVIPQLRMTHWDCGRPFDVDGLAFAVEWEHRFEPGFPVFTKISRDGLALSLTEHQGDCQVGGAAYIIVDDVDALFQEISGRGIRPAEAPEDAPWGSREMLVLDPDGNRLRFANPSQAWIAPRGGLALLSGEFRRTATRQSPRANLRIAELGRGDLGSRAETT
jgi:hypothetical protein